MSKRICIFGASITWGAGDKEKGGWVNRLRIYLDNNYEEYRTYNMGISGDNTNDILRRIKPELKARNPRIILFNLGTNDSSYRDSIHGPQISQEKFEKNIKMFFDIAKEYTDKIVFIGPSSVNEEFTNPIPWNKDGHYFNKDILKYKKILESFCSENSLNFIDIFDLLGHEDLEDGLHPNAEGHEKIFQKVKKYLIENEII